MNAISANTVNPRISPQVLLVQMAPTARIRLPLETRLVYEVVGIASVKTAACIYPTVAQFVDKLHCSLNNIEQLNLPLQRTSGFLPLSL